MDAERYDSILAVIENKEGITFTETVRRISAYLRRKSAPASREFTANVTHTKKECEHCGQKGHAKRTYWKLHGKPGSASQGESELAAAIDVLMKTKTKTKLMCGITYLRS
ncbi:hypothetical protein AAMO2058_001254300 [Amorphochlora amoebiformis]